MRGSQLTMKYLIYMRFFTRIIYESVFQGLSATRFEIFHKFVSGSFTDNFLPWSGIYLWVRT